MYRVYQVLTASLLVTVFIMAGFFVALVAVNTSGARLLQPVARCSLP